jgi:hypothetical protein
VVNISLEQLYLLLKSSALSSLCNRLKLQEPGAMQAPYLTLALYISAMHNFYEVENGLYGIARYYKYCLQNGKVGNLTQNLGKN